MNRTPAGGFQPCGVDPLRMTGVAMSKYDKLGAYLESSNGSEWHASFRQLEFILGFALPASARLYSAWWANDARQGRQAMAWLLAGWRAGDLNLTSETVTFYRDAGAGGKAVPTSGQGSQRAGVNGQVN